MRTEIGSCSRATTAVWAGAISKWALKITTSTAQIVVPASGTSGVANPYPSVKSFTTPAGQVIDDLNLKVTGFDHQHPADVDMMSQGPTGQRSW